METLKLTTLAMLIPVGLWIPHTTAACPVTADQIEVAGHHSPEAHCIPSPVHQPNPKEQDNQTHACRLDLMPIDTD